MRFPSLSSIVCCALLAFAAGARAFSVSTHEVRDHENGTFTIATVEANGENLSFVVPRGWRASVSAQGSSLSLYARWGESPINISFSTEDAQRILMSTEALRQSIVPFLKDATVTGEFPAYSAYGPGRGIDLSYALQGSGMSARAVVIPLSHGHASFVLTCPNDDWLLSERIFGSTLTSFRRATKEAPQESVRNSVQPPGERGGRVEPLVAMSIPGADVPEPVDDDVNLKPAPKTIFDGREEYVLLGVLCVLLAVLIARTLARHKREAEIRALSGAYLSDGTEIARFKMPSLFETPLSQANLDFPQDDDRGADKIDGAVADKGPLTEFFEAAPERLAEVRKLLSELSRAFDEDDRKQALLKLHEVICALKGKAECWDLRPVWQLTSALELFLKRLAEKGKEATPSTLRTVAGAIDVLVALCVPGVRPDLIINPPISLLAVDDDPLCLRAVVFALQKAEMAPDLAQDGEAAVAKAAEKSYDVVFMDIMMPVMDGLTACSKIHETPKNKTTPVVFVTARSDFRARTESTLVGGADLIAKPFLMFEITVKALTFAMRKRLDLAESCRRDLAALDALSRSENHGLPSQPIAA